MLTSHAGILSSGGVALPKEWAQVGNPLTVTVSSTDQIPVAAMTPTRVAYWNNTSDILQTYDWDGTDWSAVGNGFSLAGNAFAFTTGLDSSTIALYWFITGELLTYSFNGTDWSLVGNGLFLGTNDRVALSALSSTEIAAANNSTNTIAKYSWSGTDWTLVGNALTIATFDNPATAALDSSTIAFIDATNDELRTYSFNGTDWTQVGNGLTITHTNGAMGGLTSTRIAFKSGYTDLAAYDWDGTDWAHSGTDINFITSPGVSMDGLNSTDIVVIDVNTNSMSTYRFS